MKNYYAILGVSSLASQDEIKRAYRKLVVTYHPDKNPDPKAAQTIRNINEAYDVLGDASKRAAYDLRLNSPLEELIGRPVPHRDPAYRRQRPPTPRSYEPVESESLILMRQYLPYFYWLSVVGLVISVLFFVDYILPYKVEETRIVKLEIVHGRREIAYFNSFTEDGRKIKCYPEAKILLYAGAHIRWSRTVIFSRAMWIEHQDGSGRARLAYMYRSFIFVPLILLMSSSLGIVFRERTEWCFNASLISGVFLLFYWYLL